MLPLHMQHHPASNQHFQLETGGEHISNDAPRRYNLLEVVQDEQERLIAQDSPYLLQERKVFLFLNVEHLRERGQHCLSTTELVQRHKTHAIRKEGTQLIRHLQGQACFPYPGGTHQRDQAHICPAQQVSNRCHLLLAANKGG